MQVNPYSNEIRYTLGLMAYHLSLTQPTTVRIASHSIEMVKSVVRYLGHLPTSLFVETAEIRDIIANSLGVNVNIVESGSGSIDAALFPFSLEEGMQPAGEKTIVAACYNALSYKGLLHPLSIQGTIFRKLRRLRDRYYLNTVAGLYSPQFALRLSLAKMVEHWDSALYFQLEDHAMRQLIESGPLWRLRYIVVIAGRSAS